MADRGAYLAGLFREEAWSDCEVVLALKGGGEELDRFPAHSLLLRAGSGVLRAQLERWPTTVPSPGGDGANNLKGPAREAVRVALESADELPAALEAVRCMYRGAPAPGLSAAELLSVLRAADYLQADACAGACAEALGRLEPGPELLDDLPCPEDDERLEAFRRRRFEAAVRLHTERPDAAGAVLRGHLGDLLRVWRTPELHADFRGLPEGALRLLLGQRGLACDGEETVSLLLREWGLAREDEGVVTDDDDHLGIAALLRPLELCPVYLQNLGRWFGVGRERAASLSLAAGLVAAGGERDAVQEMLDLWDLDDGPRIDVRVRGPVRLGVAVPAASLGATGSFESERVYHGGFEWHLLAKVSWDGTRGEADAYLVAGLPEGLQPYVRGVAAVFVRAEIRRGGRSAEVPGRVTGPEGYCGCGLEVQVQAERREDRGAVWAPHLEDGALRWSATVEF